jgi:DNA primase
MNRNDIRDIKERHDLRQIVEQDLGPALARGGQALLWRCPFHHERKGHSLAVWANGYCCFGKCQMSGDALDWLQRYRGLSFPEAVYELDHGTAAAQRTSTQRPELRDDAPPTAAWQAAGQRVVDWAEEMLWSEQGHAALNYLLGRGLTSKTIQAAHLGHIPGAHRQWKTIAGLRVPCGITIPWFTDADSVLWAVKVRREFDTPKYVQIKGGSRGGLYQADRLKGAKAVLFCEGEFDTLLAQQEGESLVSAVTLGSASSRLSRRWLVDLLRVPLILAAYDMDDAGEKGTARLLNISQRVHPVHVPFGKDLTEYHLQGGCLHSWLVRELRQICHNALLTSQEGGEK